MLLLLLGLYIISGMNLVELLFYLIDLCCAYRRWMFWVSCSSFCSCYDILLRFVAVLCPVLEAKEISPGNSLCAYIWVLKIVFGVDNYHLLQFAIWRSLLWLLTTRLVLFRFRVAHGRFIVSAAVEVDVPIIWTPWLPDKAVLRRETRISLALEHLEGAAGRAAAVLRRRLQVMLTAITTTVF